MKRPANQPGVFVSEGVATGMRVAVDAMGGDFGPAVTVPSSLVALADPEYPDLSIVFVGQHDKIEPLLSGMAEDQRRRVRIVDAPDEVAMSDAAARAVRSKPKSSMAVGLQLLKSGEAALGAAIHADAERIGPRHDLALVYVLLGDVKLQQGDKAAARTAWTKGREVLEPLKAEFEQNPDCADRWQELEEGLKSLDGSPVPASL